MSASASSRWEPNQRKGLIVTVLVHVAMLVAIFIFGIRYLDPPPLGGMIVAFGMTEDGAGSPAYEDRAVLPQPTAAASSVPEVEVPEEALMTQVEESPVEVEEKKPEKEQKPNTEQRPREVERPRETPQKEETPQPPQPSRTTTQALANILNPGHDASKGDGQGQGYKGSPQGSLSSDNYGVSGVGGDGNYRLAGRSAIRKPKPAYTGTDQGRVVVVVQVDRQGNVVSAKCSLQGTEVTDPQLIRNAEKAALETKWKPDPSAEPLQQGTIIYEFSVRG